MCRYDACFLYAVVTQCVFASVTVPCCYNYVIAECLLVPCVSFFGEIVPDVHVLTIRMQVRL